MSAALQGDSQEIVVMTRLYDAAVRQLVLKFEILNDEFKVLYARNPIHHIEGRVKSLPSIAAKLLKKGNGDSGLSLSVFYGATGEISVSFGAVTLTPWFTEASE